MLCDCENFEPYSWEITVEGVTVKDCELEECSSLLIRDDDPLFTIAPGSEDCPE